MTILKFIIFICIAFMFGFLSHCIISGKKEPEKADKHEIENLKYDLELDSLKNYNKIQDEKYANLELRINKTDSILRSNDKKNNDAKNNFHRSNHSAFNDSVLRANNLLNR